MMIHAGGGAGSTRHDVGGGGNGPGDPPPSSGSEEPAPTPDRSYIVGGYIAVVIAAVVAILLASKNDVTIGVSEGFAPFAVIYLIAQAIERGLQPFTYLLGKPAEKSEAKQKLQTARITGAIDSAVTEQKKLEVLVADRAILFWAIATVVSLLVCGLLELGLIQSIAEVTGSSGEVPKWFQYTDVIVTGIAIGAGTKPLHDFIALVQNAKQKSEPGTESG